METIPFWFQLTVVGMLAACLGSFLNVCIYRLPRSQSIVLPRSQCPHCHHALYWYHNIPMVSFLLLRAKCHFCGNKISWRYFIVEVVTTIIIMNLYLFSFSTPNPFLFFGIMTLFSAGLIVATFIDLEFYLIPDTVSLGGIPLGILSSTLMPFMMEQNTPLWGGLHSLFAALFGGSLMLLISFLGKLAFKKEAMGMGDIKLMAMIGAFLGLKKICMTLFFGSIVGSAVGIALILSERAGLKSQIPFGPYLAAGAFISLFVGDPLWNWYFNF